MFKKCNICGKVIKVINNESSIICCNEEMIDIKANSTDAAFEKHVPNYEIKDNKIIVTVNHVMEKEHFIEWISLVKENTEITVKLYPEQDAIARFPYMKGATIYAYCNKHELWSAEVE